MACYHQFSFHEKTKSEALVEESGEGHNLSETQKPRVKSYGWCIFV